MNREEIKSSIKMSDLLRQYGIEVRGNMCKCPFHSDSTPSMKVFTDGVKCFTCNKSWDCFGFVQEYEHCDFKTAFISLGGTYEHLSGDGELLRRARIERERKRREQAERDRKDHQKAFYKAWTLAQVLVSLDEPFSEAWTDSMNILDMIDRHLFDFEKGEDITQDVYIRCIKFNKKYLAIE